jgi:CubicO group peptidase (beta-lactamase class C family)
MSCEDGRQGRSPLGVRVSSMRRVLACFFALTAALPALVPLAATAASGAPGCASRPAPADGGYEELASVLEPLRQKYNLPALGAAVVTPDGVKALGVVGIRKYGDTTPACVEDAFHLGSDTKAMTAVVIAKLVEQGKLKWTTTVRDLLSDITAQDPAYASVTLDQLLAHRSGLAHDPTSVSNDALRHLEGSMHARREAYARIALHEAPAKPPGTIFFYSNTGYVLAGLMAERATGRPWEELVRDTLFLPLAMKGAGFGITASPGQVDGLWAHEEKAGVPVPVEPGLNSDNPIFMSPAGNVHVSMEGWAQFIADMLRGFEGTGRVLSKASYQHLHTPPFEGTTYAYGWETLDRGWAGGTAYSHAGSNTLNYAVAWVAPKRRFAVLVATNIRTDTTPRACDDVASVLLKPYLGQ